MLRSYGNHRYHLGSQIFELSSRGLEQREVRGIAAPHLTAFIREHTRTTHLSEPSGSEIVYIDKLESHDQLRLASRIGLRAPVHSTAAGKVLAADLSPAGLERVLAGATVARDDARAEAIRLAVASATTTAATPITHGARRRSCRTGPGPGRGSTAGAVGLRSGRGHGAAVAPAQRRSQRRRHRALRGILGQTGRSGRCPRHPDQHTLHLQPVGRLAQNKGVVDGLLLDQGGEQPPHAVCAALSDRHPARAMPPRGEGDIVRSRALPAVLDVAGDDALMGRAVRVLGGDRI